MKRNENYQSYITENKIQLLKPNLSKNITHVRHRIDCTGNSWIYCLICTTYGKWSDPLSVLEVKPPQVVECSVGGGASSKYVHGFVIIAGTVRVSLSNVRAHLRSDTCPGQLPL